MNKTDHSRFTTLMHTSANNRLEQAKLLIQSGAHVNARNDEGETALIATAMKGSLNCVEFLLHSGADVNVTSNSGATALIHAVVNGLSA